MSIIFEGVDGIGKTTQAKEFLSISPYYYYIHNWAKPIKDEDITSEIVKEMLLLTNRQPMLFDRSFVISEYVYSKVLNRHSVITDEHINILCRLMNGYKHVLKLFIFENIDDLIIKAEDAWLPFVELNKEYIRLTKDFNFDLLLIEYVNERGKNEQI